jgi:hypothetical protein
MQTTFAIAALAAVAFAAPQGVTTDIEPKAAAPAGCSTNYNGQFEITVVTASTKRSLLPRQSTCGQDGYLTLSLAGGQLKDAKGRTGYIAANYQFQFDAPPQTGAIYTGGFSVCNNGSLALGGSAVFYECLSGSFYNLYDRSWAAQCSPILIDLIPCGGSSAVGQKTDGQPTGTTVGPKPVSQITDGQPQGASATPIVVSEFTDGQPQVLTVLPKPPVTQISDGQVQATTGTAKPVPVTQISDGQVQATTATAKPAPVTQISDGQIQATTATGAPVTQISDGQVQATVTSKPSATAPASNFTATTATPATFTGAASSVTIMSSFAAAVVGLVAVVLL